MEIGRGCEKRFYEAQKEWKLGRKGYSNFGLTHLKHLLAARKGWGGGEKGRKKKKHGYRLPPLNEFEGERSGLEGWQTSTIAQRNWEVEFAGGVSRK